MGKDRNEKNAQVASVTSENVMDIIRNGNLMNQALTKKVQDEIEKEKDERKAQLLKTRVLRSQYRRLVKLLQVRKRRAESNLTLEILKKSELLQDALSGFVLTEEKIKRHGGTGDTLEIEVIVGDGKKEKQTFKLKKGEEVWVPGSITPNEYDEEDSKIVSEEYKKMDEIDTNYRKEVRELESQYPNYFSFSWRW